jgi:hypothetical protein
MLLPVDIISELFSPIGEMFTGCVCSECRHESAAEAVRNLGLHGAAQKPECPVPFVLNQWEKEEYVSLQNVESGMSKTCLGQSNLGHSFCLL